MSGEKSYLTPKDKQRVRQLRIQRRNQLREFNRLRAGKAEQIISKRTLALPLPTPLGYSPAWLWME